MIKTVKSRILDEPCYNCETCGKNNSITKKPKFGQLLMATRPEVLQTCEKNIPGWTRHEKILKHTKVFNNC